MDEVEIIDPSAPVRGAAEEFAAWCVIMSQAAAYRIAYPHVIKKQWNGSSIHEAASKLAARVDVAARIEWLRKEAAARHRVTQDRVLRELVAVAFGNVAGTIVKARLVGDKMLMTVEDFENLTPEEQATIAAVKIKRVWVAENVEQETIEVKAWNKVSALGLLMKHLGMMERNSSDRLPVLNFNFKRQTPPVLEAVTVQDG